MLISLFIFLGRFQLWHPSYAEDVIFIVPGSSDPSIKPSLDPTIQIIQKDQSITFVNPDGLDHELLVKDANGKQVFDTGVLRQNQFISHTFTENGEYSIQDAIYAHINGQILVTDDLLTLTKSIDSEHLDVQLTRSPANPGVNDSVYYKITFIDKQTGRNHPHIDFTLTFNDSKGNYVDGVGGHTVDGQEFAKFKFDKQDTFTPAVTISGISFIPIKLQPLAFPQIVTPEFPPILVGTVMAGAIGVTIALYRRRFDIHLP